jgi:peroxiredoxin
MSLRLRQLVAGGLMLAALAIAGIVVLVDRNNGAVSAPPPTRGQAAPNFTVQATNGRLSLASLRGAPVVFGFMQPNCGSCGVDLQRLSAVAHTAIGRRARFIAINYLGGGSAQALAAFGGKLGASNITYTADRSGAVVDRYVVTSLDTVIVIRARGQIVWRGLQPSTHDLIAALTRAQV